MHFQYLELIIYYFSKIKYLKKKIIWTNYQKYTTRLTKIIMLQLY